MTYIPASQPCISPYLSHLFPDKPALRVTHIEDEYQLRIEPHFPLQHQIYLLRYFSNSKSCLRHTADISKNVILLILSLQQNLQPKTYQPPSPPKEQSADDL